MHYKVGLVQINNSFSGQNYLPYSVGLLQSYAQKYLTRAVDFKFCIPIYKRIKLKQAQSRLLGCDIVFFSVYAWNINLSLEIAKQLKLINKDVIIVFGGPQVPFNDISGFLRKHFYIDIACHGEGEVPFLKILENIEAKDWSGVPNISYISKDGKVTNNKCGVRATDLSVIPSPYLEGVFDRLMKTNPKENWVALWETNRGCPFTCAYCVWGACANNKIYQRNISQLFQEIDWFRKKRIEFIFCCDANFGILPRDIEIARYAAKSKARFGYPKALSVQNTKNSSNRIYDLYEIMAGAKLSKGVSLAIQSMNPKTLKAINRENIRTSTFQELQKQFNRKGVETFTDVILGLPAETYSSFVDGVSNIISNGQHNRIQFNNLSILTGSEMDNAAYRKKYGIVTVNNKLINIHGSISDKNEIDEFQRLVMATKAMPKEDWIKARVFGWTAGLFYFNKILQIPLVLLHKKCGASYRMLIERLMFAGRRYSVISGIMETFKKKAIDITKGGNEFAQSKKWLSIWWPPDELSMIECCSGGKLDALFAEAEDILSKITWPNSSKHAKGALFDAFTLNKKVLKLPFHNDILNVELSYNIWSYYRNVIYSENVPLKKGDFVVKIDRRSEKWNSWEDWCREVIWYGNKRGAYLYPARELQ